ncbi:MAG: hypothetical protein HYW07_09980 [Candidatus Latescibacteria bacterium]|nr:hypothetical protein [Candidatus Latescibacterota bacterium]
MEEMVEPDRTIMIVSIIGLVIIWGSVLYHKLVQGGSPSQEELGGPEAARAEGPANQTEGSGRQKQRKKRK